MSEEKKKILVVEDDAILSDTYFKYLEKRNYEIETAFDGEEAIKKVEKFGPDLILLDLIMPKIDGIGVLKALKNKEETKNIPILLLTNLEDQDKIAEAVVLGCPNYLIKTEYTLDDIEKKMKDLMGV